MVLPPPAGVFISFTSTSHCPQIEVAGSDDLEVDSLKAISWDLEDQGKGTSNPFS